MYWFFIKYGWFALAVGVIVFLEVSVPVAGAVLVAFWAAPRLFPWWPVTYCPFQYGPGVESCWGCTLAEWQLYWPENDYLTVEEAFSRV